MQKLSILVLILLAACSAAEKEVLTTSVNIDQAALPALLSQIDALSENALDVDKILALAESTPMDKELQETFAVTYQGSKEEMLVHIWREHVDWIHLNFSSTSSELIDAIEKTSEVYARAGED